MSILTVFLHMISRNNITFLEERTLENDVLKIKGCQHMHMICFIPDGTNATKQNICSSDGRLIRDFLNCVNEKCGEF